MSSKLLFDEYDLKGYCSSDILKKAKRDFLKGKVLTHRFSSNEIRGEIALKEGRSKVLFSKKKGVKFSCSHEKCSGFCLHIATLCLYYLESVSARKSRSCTQLDVEKIELYESKESLDNFFDPILGIEQLKNNLGIVLDISEDKGQFSLSFSELKSKKTDWGPLLFFIFSKGLVSVFTKDLRDEIETNL